ncbi:cupin domain-containing protein [Paenibacillus sp. M1]|uniref:Cupin domain-containing protein n=1 Tax=Paenibacillus haidiansis TaxID=1574488 RepID=A0ABU7VVT3_9BACL
MNIPFKQVFALNGLVTYRDHQITSRTLAGDDHLDLILYAMDSDESISRESSPHHKTIYVTDGQLKIQIDRESFAIKEGEFLRIEKNIVHSIEALGKCKFVQLNYMNE